MGALPLTRTRGCPSLIPISWKRSHGPSTGALPRGLPPFTQTQRSDRENFTTHYRSCSRWCCQHRPSRLRLFCRRRRGEDDGPVTLTLATFNDFGYSDELLAEFTEETGIKVVHNKAATSNDARANYFQKLGNTGLADVEAVEIDWFTEAMQYSDLLAPVPDDLKGRWLDWKEAAATDADGNLIAYGTDIGPQAICYRSDLFAAAGLPTDRAEVAELFDGDWDNFFTIGADYKAATGKPFIDSANSVLQGIVNQFELAYEDPDGSIIATENPDIQAAYEDVVTKAVPISAYSGQWSEDWFASMASGEFAAMLCPGWMLGSSPATPRTSPVGTSLTSSRAAAETGAART